MAVPLSDEDDYKLNMESLSEISDELFQMEEMASVQPNSVLEPNLQVVNYENTEGGTHQDCSVWHRGYWEFRDAMTPCILKSTSMNVKGIWDGYGAAYKMQLHQLIEFSGAAADISVPPGFEKNGSTNTYTWSSFGYENTPFVLAYIGDAEATSVVSTLETTVKSGADIYPTNSLSYSSSVSDSRSILGG